MPSKHVLLTGLASTAYDSLRKRLEQRTACREQAADIAQESFARLAAVDDLAAIEDPRAFLYRVADNLAADAYDHQQVRARYSEPDLDPDTLPSSSPGPEAATDCHRRLERVEHALSQLPDLYRFAFLLNRIEGLTYAEVAGRLGISEKTVERYIKKALAVCIAAVED